MKTKLAKQEIVQELTTAFKKADAVLFLNLSNLQNNLQTKLRQTLKRNQGLMKVSKLTLMQKAWPSLSVDVKQPIALLFDFSNDLQAFRLLRQFQNQINLLGGWYQKPLTPEAALELIHLPSKDILVQKLLVLLTSPIRNLSLLSKLTKFKLTQTLAKIADTKTSKKS
jgi:ribosomal protein L10